MKNFSKGFTLIEFLISIAVIGVIIAITVPSLISFRKNQAIQNSTNAVVSLLEEARAKTLASYNNTFYSVKFDSDKATMFTGGTYSSASADNKVLLYEVPVVLQTVSLNGSGSSVSFDRIKGTTSQYGTIILQIPSSSSRTITVSAGGIVSRN